MTDRQPIALVVDDEPLVRMSAADIITEAGFDVLEAADAEEAVFYLKQYPSLRLLFTDVRMPEIDGLTLAKHVKSKWPHVSVIVTSGAVVPTDKQLPEDARFIAKPFSPTLLVETIREVCGLPPL
jgi:CheY-like chemotaxis protein